MFKMRWKTITSACIHRAYENSNRDRWLDFLDEKGIDVVDREPYEHTYFESGDLRLELSVIESNFIYDMVALIDDKAYCQDRFVLEDMLGKKISTFSHLLQLEEKTNFDDPNTLIDSFSKDSTPWVISIYLDFDGLDNERIAKIAAETLSKSYAGFPVEFVSNTKDCITVSVNDPYKFIKSLDY